MTLHTSMEELQGNHELLGTTLAGECEIEAASRQPSAVDTRNGQVDLLLTRTCVGKAMSCGRRFWLGSVSLTSS